MSKVGPEYLNSNQKRLFDIAGALGMLTLGGLGLSAIMAGCALDTRANPLFIQQRLGGKGSNTFGAFKARTIDPRKVRGPFVAHGTHDPRASRYGNGIRGSGVDELPQAFNILLGDMTLVAPRPMPLSDVLAYKEAAPQLFEKWYEGFSTCLPGVFGPSQMYRKTTPVRTQEVMAHSMKLDLGYYATACLKEDAELVAITVAGLSGLRPAKMMNHIERLMQSQAASEVMHMTSE